MSSEITYSAHTAAEAVALFDKVSFLYQTVPGRKSTTKSRRLRTIYLQASVMLPIPGTNQYYTRSVHTKLTVEAAREMLADMARYAEGLEGKGARLAIGHSDNCIFLGGTSCGVDVPETDETEEA